MTFRDVQRKANQLANFFALDRARQGRQGHAAARAKSVDRDRPRGLLEGRARLGAGVDAVRGRCGRLSAQAMSAARVRHY